MADNEVEENQTHGAEWEVVSLTASTYAAAPGPNKPELKDDEEGILYKEDEAETSRALFLSGHFEFPPRQHENLPLELDSSKILDSHVGKKVASEVNIEEGNKSVGKDVEDWSLKGLEVSGEFPGSIFDEKDNKLPISATGFDDLMNLENEKSFYSTATFSSLHREIKLGGLTLSKTLHSPKASEVSDPVLDNPADISRSPKSVIDNKHDESSLPREGWWKRTAASLYGHAKEANTFWPIFIAAAVVGLVILGQRWQQERRHALQLKWQATINNERSGKMMVPMYLVKDTIVVGQRHGSFVGGSSSIGN